MKKQLKKNIKKAPDQISMRQSAKVSFNEHEGLYRLVVENLEDYAIFTTDKNAIVTSWNIGAEKLLGFKAQDILAHDINIVFSTKDREKDILKKEFVKALKVGRTISEGYHFRKDGTTFWASCLVFPIHATVNHVEGFTLIIRDLTHQKEIEQRKDDFINVASHQLKTPMTSMKIFAHIVEKQARKMGDDTLTDFIKKLNTQIDGLGKLINRLLDVSKLQSGKLEIKRELFNFDELAQEVIAAMQEYSKENVINYVRKFEKKLKINGDKDLISQILVNLLSNATKYSGENTKVIFEARSTKDKLIISIQDFGIGIEDKDQDKVFQRFFRTEAAKQNKINGVGLGLYIVKEIVTGHGGKVWFKSKVNLGSTFYFTLPIK